MEIPPEQIESVSVEGREKPMRYLGTLVICVLVIGLTASAYAELKSAEVNGSVRVRGVWMTIPDAPNLGWEDAPDLDAVEQRSGLDFFRELPDTEENALQSVTNTAWVQTW